MIEELMQEAEAIRREGGEQMHADLMVRAAKRIEVLEQELNLSEAAERKGFTCTSCGNQFLQSVCTTCRAEKLYDNTLKAAEQRAEAAERRLNYVLDNTPLSRVENMLSIKVFSLTGESATRNERCCAAIDAALERREHYSAPPMKEEGK